MKRRDFILSTTLAGTATVLTAAVADTPANRAPSSPDEHVANGPDSRERADVLHPVRRCFVRARNQGVHYLRAGEGPPVVLLHPGGMGVTAGYQLPLLKELASDHTVFAFDHPGYGDSDALPMPSGDVTLSHVADALEATLVALDMPPCPVYGTHTGGGVALELAVRHPERVSALIVDGPCMFRPEETEFYRSDAYLWPFTVRDDGSHLLASWVTKRDWSMWFPWSKRTAENRSAGPMPSAERLHGGFVDFLRSGDGYRAIYRAAFTDGRKAVEALIVPATFMAASNDLLLTHLDRLPGLKRDQRILRPPADHDYKTEVARVLRGYRVKAKSPNAPFQPTTDAINRRYVDVSSGQILVRSAGEARSGRPLLLLHEGRASSCVFEPLMRVLAKHRPVYAPDLPDNGASDPLAVPQPGIRDYANVVAETVAALRLESCDVYAVGAGAAVALDLLGRAAFTNAHGLLEAPDFYAPSFARTLAREWAPPLAPEWDGAHLNRLWLMLRDEYAFWPWFDKSLAARCAIDVPTDWHEMHTRVVDILRSLPTYHRLTLAALQYEWTAPLREAGTRGVKLAASANDPRRAHAEAAARISGRLNVAVLPFAINEKAQEILRLMSHQRIAV